MGKSQRTTILKEELELEERDPIAAAIKASLEAGDPLPETITEYEFDCKVQQLDRRGRAVQGVALQTPNLTTLFEEILDELGPGRYTVWCKFRPVGKEGKWSLVKVSDIVVEDPNAPPAPPGQERIDPGERRDVLQVMLAQMNQTTQMMIAQQNQMTQVLVAALSKGGSGSDGKTLLEAIRTGADLAGAPLGEEDEEEGGLLNSPLAKLGLQLIELLKGKGEGDAIPAGTVRKLVTDTGVDEALRGAGFTPKT